MRLTEPTEPPGPGLGGAHPMNPTSAKRIALFGSIIVVLFGILVVRLWFLQVVGAQGFEAAAVGNSVRTINIPAPRGQILDRNGEVLAGTRPSWDVVALPQDIEGDAGDLTLRRLGRVLDQDPTRLRRLMTIGEKRAPYKSVVLLADLNETEDRDLLFALRERIRDYPGIRLERTYRRDYPFGSSLSHVLGWVGPITAEEIEERRRQGYRNDAIVGRAGLEVRYEEFLKGTDGERRLEVDAAGQPVGRGTISERPAKPGNTLQTTIDINVQTAFEGALREYVERFAEAKGGAGGAVLDIETGEVIAIATYPELDRRVLSRGRKGEVDRLQRNPRRPFLNRAIWTYPPASTFKPITAISALNSDIVAVDEFLSSPKSVPLYGTNFNNFRGLELPDMQTRHALAVSSDTFFYQVGARIYAVASQRDRLDGENQLKEWAQALGLGRSSGIDIPNEQGGDVPDRAWKYRNYKDLPPDERDRDWDKWRPGDTINMSIGQGLLKASPLQMARAYAAILNGGRVLTPAVGWKVVDPVSQREISDLAKGRAESRIPPIRPDVLDSVLGGMFDAVNTSEGTAHPAFSGLYGLVAGKTGTAENRPNRDHAWFVGYGPAGSGAKPKYVVAVIVENSGLGGAVAAPVACRALAPAIAYDPTRCRSGFRATPNAQAGGD